MTKRNFILLLSLTFGALGSVVSAQVVSGCTYPGADNFNAEATVDDGSCLFEGVYLEGFADGLEQCYGEDICGLGTFFDSESGTCLPANCLADLNQDGIRGTSDLLILLSYFGSPCAWGCGQPIEYNGYFYSTESIGEDCWFSENLRTDKYTNEEFIPYHSTCFDENSYTTYVSDSLTSIYGFLYGGGVSTDPRGVCPNEWHVSNSEDWNGLLDVLNTNYGGSVSAIKAASPFWNGTNDTGLNLMPGGAFCWYYGYDSYYEVGNIAFFRFGGTGIWQVDNSVTTDTYGEDAKFSIRCVKN